MPAERLRSALGLLPQGSDHDASELGSWLKKGNWCFVNKSQLGSILDRTRGQKNLFVLQLEAPGPVLVAAL